MHRLNQLINQVKWDCTGIGRGSDGGCSKHVVNFLVAWMYAG